MSETLWHLDSITDRFAFQRAAVTRAVHNKTGLILNVGCKEDPVPLKPLAPDRVVNCDISDYDFIENRPNCQDVLFDCARDRWPYNDREACLVVMGDILEHLGVEDVRFALAEARRVGGSLAVTTPHDTSPDMCCDEFANRFARGERHRTCFTEALLRELLVEAGWKVTHFRTVDYVFLPEGYLVFCE